MPSGRVLYRRMVYRSCFRLVCVRLMDRGRSPYDSAIAINDHLVPLAADDPLLTRLRQVAAAGDEPDDAFWEEYGDAIAEMPRTIDMWRLGIHINEALSADLPIDPRELVWTDGAEVIHWSGFYATYLPPARLQARVASMAHLTRNELARRINAGAGRNVSREELVARTAKVLDMMRWSAAHGLGLLRDFSA